MSNENQEKPSGNKPVEVIEESSKNNPAKDIELGNEEEILESGTNEATNTESDLEIVLKDKENSSDNNPIPNNPITIEKNKILVDVFKGYLDTAITANIAFYGLTGAILAYYLTNREGKGYLIFSLLVPFILGVLVVSRSLVGMGQAYKFKQVMLQEKCEPSTEKFSYWEILFKGKHSDTNCIPVDVLVGFLRASVFSVSLVCLGIILIMIYFTFVL